MNKTEFHMVLPSDSSLNYYPNNTATNYTTKLPEHVKIEGQWVVGLKEIQFPASFLHIQSKKESKICLIRAEGSKDICDDFYFPPGLYNDPKRLVHNLTYFLPTMKHFHFEINDAGYTKVKRIREPPFCKDNSHRLELSNTLLDILGFERYTDRNKQQKFVIGNRKGRSYEFTSVSQRPLSLIRGLLNSLFIYSDICSLYVTGDVNSALLRIIPIDASSYTYGMMITSTYGSPNYIPVLSNTFRTIEIDIRDNDGDPVPFDYGPLNVILHFKRVD